MNQTQAVVVRTFLYRILIILAFFGLAIQLWRLQVNQGDVLRARANQNRFRAVSEPALRGVIYEVHNTFGETHSYVQARETNDVRVKISF